MGRRDEGLPLPKSKPKPKDPWDDSPDPDKEDPSTGTTYVAGTYVDPDGKMHDFTLRVLISKLHV